MKDVELLRSFGVLSRTFLSYFTECLADAEIGYSEGIILANVGADADATQQSLAEKLVIDRAAVARALKKLESHGFIRSERSVADRRVKELHLTPKGEGMLRDIARWNRAWIDGVTQDLTSTEMGALTTMLEKIAGRAKSQRSSTDDL